jgi:hypothetical protein
MQKGIENITGFLLHCLFAPCTVRLLIKPMHSYDPTAFDRITEEITIKIINHLRVKL